MHRTSVGPWKKAAAAAAVALAIALPAAGHGAHHPPAEPEGAADATAAFERLKSLAGRWEGTAAGEPGGVVEYRVASGGHVVMETMFPGTPHEMISIYHLEGDRLVMTHYCSGGTRPKLALTAASAGELRFDFAGGADLDPARDVHVHAGRISWREDGGLESGWTFWRNGAADGEALFVLERAAP